MPNPGPNLGPNLGVGVGISVAVAVNRGRTPSVHPREESAQERVAARVQLLHAHLCASRETWASTARRCTIHRLCPLHLLYLLYLLYLVYLVWCAGGRARGAPRPAPGEGASLSPVPQARTTRTDQTQRRAGARARLRLGGLFGCSDLSAKPREERGGVSIPLVCSCKESVRAVSTYSRAM